MMAPTPTDKRTTNQSYATALTGLSRYISIFMSLSLAVKYVRFTLRRVKLYGP